MGAPKQKWTAEEETALKAGVLKHGPGKWRTILLDPVYTRALSNRSNVDLKDKWRNISVTAVFGSRKKAAIALRKTLRRDGDNSTALAIVAMAGRRRINPASRRAASCKPPPRDFQGLFTSVDKASLEAVTKLDRPLGLDGKSIGLYIDENCNLQPNMKRLVSSRLKHLVNVGALVKTKLKYRISPNYAAAEANGSSPQLVPEGNKENSPTPEENGVQVDGGLLKIQGMTAQEAAVAAARAVAEAEFAAAEAEEAARAADEAEAMAEAANIFAKAALKTLKQSMQSQTR